MDTTNATKIVEALDAVELRQRLNQLTSEQNALRVLLRVVRTRDRQRAKGQQQPAGAAGGQR